MRGHCHCGAVEWRVDGPVTWSALCHCDDCRRIASAPIVAFLGALRCHVTWQGRPAIYASAPGNERLFCGVCSSALAFRGARYPDGVFLHAATMNDPAGYRPDCYVMTDAQLAWLKIDDDLPRHPGFNEGKVT